MVVHRFAFSGIIVTDFLVVFYLHLDLYLNLSDNIT